MAYFVPESILYNSTVSNFENKWKIFKYRYLKKMFLLKNNYFNFIPVSTQFNIWIVRTRFQSKSLPLNAMTSLFKLNIKVYYRAWT